MLKRKSSIDEAGPEKKARVVGLLDGYDIEASNGAQGQPDSTGRAAPDPDNYLAGDEDEDEDDEGDPEFEIEETEYNIPFTIRTYMTVEECEEWTQLIHVRAMHKGKEIGRADGRHIDRDQIREYFHEAMEEPSRDTLDLATELFDSRGRLKSEFRAGDGSGIWGNEMNTGGLLLLQTIGVEKEWRGKGIGRDIVEVFLKKGRSWNEEVQFVFVKPGQLNTREVRYEQQNMTQQQVIAAVARDRKNAIAFWRALGFRRIGSSEWFAITFDEMHMVHQLAAEDDYDTPEDAVPEQGEHLDEEDDEGEDAPEDELAAYEPHRQIEDQESASGEDHLSGEDLDQEEEEDEVSFPADKYLLHATLMN